MGIVRRLRVLLASRNLFHNWLSAGIRYYLINRGLVDGDIDVKFKCNNNSNYILSRWIYSLIVNAYYDGLFKTLCDGELIGKFYSVIDLLYKNGKFILRMPDGVLLTVDSFNSIIIETWLYDIHYLGFNLNNWFILDIGAFVGDTALYYAKRGAFVVAIEPLLSNYETMIRNLELNPELKSRIIPMNAAIANEDGFVEFKYNTTFDGGASIYNINSRFVAKVKSMKLSTLLKEISNMGIDISKFKVRVLKADCKGCEYDMINDDAVKIFDIIKIEYSGYLVGKTYYELLGKLSTMGFKCRIWAHNDLAIKIGLDKHGMMTCVKDHEELYEGKKNLSVT